MKSYHVNLFIKCLTFIPATAKSAMQLLCLYKILSTWVNQLFWIYLSLKQSKKTPSSRRQPSLLLSMVRRWRLLWRQSRPTTQRLPSCTGRTSCIRTTNTWWTWSRHANMCPNHPWKRREENRSMKVSHLKFKFI